MARVTALKAYSRAKLKQTAKTKAPSTKLSSIKSTRKLSQLANNKNLNFTTHQGETASYSPSLDVDSMSTTSNIEPTGSSRKKTKKEIAKDNRKITDYYSICSRGRENCPKTPPTLKPLSYRLISMESLNITDTYKTGETNKRKSRAETITICDTDDEDKVVIRNKLTTQKLMLPKYSLNNNVKQEMDQEESDEDVEIVEMLPPIPLRNHPVHDLED